MRKIQYEELLTTKTKKSIQNRKRPKQVIKRPVGSNKFLEEIIYVRDYKDTQR